ncbi:hypothetical protein CUU66_10380 [Peribacillus deserti]|uniref:Uncharacterized protein n=1 Tax=Peribacillus deserti TaxID=673318 RepID=A0A2N5M6D2_9BACI|nr:hypothetical protein CUU66_10380 [Peribacillus deserti]
MEDEYAAVPPPLGNEKKFPISSDTGQSWLCPISYPYNGGSRVPLLLVQGTSRKAIHLNDCIGSHHGRNMFP